MSVEESIKFLEGHCIFNEPTDCYVIIAVSRKKDTPDITNSTEIVFRDVIKSKDEIKKKYLKLRASIENFRDEDGRSFPFYLYVQLNPANGRKATIELMKRITLWLEREPYDKLVCEKFKRTYAEFYSSLMIPECRGSKKFYMIDYDSKDGIIEFGQFLFENGVNCVLQATRHGYHIKCEPFDVRILEPLKSKVWELKRDGLMFVEYFENERKKTWLDPGFDISSLTEENQDA